MPQNLVDTPPDWQDEIVVPAPGEPAAVANDPGKPYSLFHALAALAKRTRWLRGLLETHNHDSAYAPLAHHHDDRYTLLGHHHDDRYYTRAEADARRNVWVATVGGEQYGAREVSIQVNVPASGSYLLEGSMVWGSHGRVHWKREILVDGTRIYLEQRLIIALSGDSAGGSWFDMTVYNLTAGAHSVVYKVTPVIETGGVSTVSGMIKVTQL